MYSPHLFLLFNSWCFGIEAIEVGLAATTTGAGYFAGAVYFARAGVDVGADEATLTGAGLDSAFIGFEGNAAGSGPLAD